MNIDDQNGTTVLHRTAEYKPGRSLSTWLIGRPLATADAQHETIGKLVGLAVFSSDALSSVAYATQEILYVLAAAGMGAFGVAVPLAFVIVGLLVILTVSYVQIIYTYPNGGGAYIVARDNFGDRPALVAAAALLTDYILTVSVSISSGVAQVVSAFPILYDYRVEIAVGMVVLIMIVNLRGVRESGMAFAIPSYFFLIMMFTMVGAGMFRYLFGSLGQVIAPPQDVMSQYNILQPLTLLLILRAFSSGTTALTGVEAISNGITAFKEPRSRNAALTLIWMSLILGSLLLGVTFLAHQVGALPSEGETVISQLGRTVFGGRGLTYIAVIAATSIILILAANTAYAGFPRLSALVAFDSFLPRQMTYRGSRLVFSRGIMALGFIASVLIVIFQASVNRLIPLYAIGVFLSFTLAQAGMARRWWKSGHLKAGDTVKEKGSILRFDQHWLIKMIVNGLGALITSVVTIIFAVSKFKDGAWIVVLLIPSLVFMFLSIYRHYRRLAKDLSLDHYGASPRIFRHRVIIPIGGVHRGTLVALRYARTLSDDITAVHVSIDPEDTARLYKKWDMWGDGIRLVILESPYRLFIEPLLQYIEEIDRKRQPNEVITIVVPQFVSRHWMSTFLHARTADTLRKVLLNREEIVITEVPYQVY